MSRRKRLGVPWICGLSALGTLVLGAGVAHAHIAMTFPKARYTSDLKYAPCGKSGAAGITRSANVTTFKPGEQIKVTWKETIGHPGHYRISFDDDGVDGFVDPKSATDFNSAPTVLVDNIADKTGTMTYEQIVTLPNVECANCTLQLIQVMTDKAPFGNGDDIYYACADLVLTSAGGADGGSDGRAPDGGADAAATDAGHGPDGGNTSDAASADEGSPDEGSPGCGCATAAPAHPTSLAAAWSLATALLATRRRAPRTRPTR